MRRSLEERSRGREGRRGGRAKSEKLCNSRLNRNDEKEASSEQHASETKSV